MADNDIRHAVTISAPIDTVWAEITKVGSKQRAQLDAVLETTFKPGDPLYYRSEDGKRVFIVGRVLACDPPFTFSHTSILTMRDDPVTVVTWTLEAVGNETRVTLVNSGWPEGYKAEKVDSTWKAIIEDLKSVVENGDVSAKGKASRFFMRTFLFAMPAKTKTENVKVPN